MPPTIVAPERDTPGTSASSWQMPMPRARRTGVCSASTTVGSGRYLSTASITRPPMMKAAAMTVRFSYSWSWT